MQHVRIVKSSGLIGLVAAFLLLGFAQTLQAACTTRKRSERSLPIFPRALDRSLRDSSCSAFYLPRCESRFQIIVVKCRRHAVDLAFGETMPRGFVAPLRD
jgi:hypothetical protein